MKSTKFTLFYPAFFFLFAGALAQAATVSGTVTDKTTGKPAAGDSLARQLSASSTTTGTWSDGLSQPRTSRWILTALSASAACGESRA